MPSQAELNAQNNASRARQQARRVIEQPALQVQQPYINPYGSQYGTDPMQDQGYYDNYYDEEEMTEEEWAAYLAGLEASSPQAFAASEEQQRMNAMSNTPPNGQIQEEREGSIIGRFLEKFADATRSDPAPQVGGGISPFGGGTAMRTGAEGASGAVVDAIQSAIPMGLPGALPFEGTPATPAVFSDDPFGVTPEEIAAAGNENFGKAVAENPYRSQYGVNSLNQGAVNEIQRQDAAGPQVQAPQGFTTAGGQPLAEFLAGGQQLDAQGRMIDPGVDRSDFERESAAREARQAARPDFGKVQRDGDTGDGAPTALFKKEAEAAGLSGRAKSEFVSERSRLWSEAKEDREIAKSSGQAAAGRAATELGIKVSAENRELTEAEKKNGIELSTAAGALNSLKADLNLVRAKGEDISKLSQKSLTEGILGKAIGKLSPTSSAAQLERASSVLTGDAFIKGMQVIKEFGGGLGSVTEEEGRNVQRAQGAVFETGMTGKERRAAVNNYIEVRENAYNRIHSQFVKQYGAEAAVTYLGDSGGNVGQAGQTGSRHADDQDHGSKVDTYYQP